MFVDIQGRHDLETRLNESSKILVVVEFFAPWCGSCKMVESKVEGLAKEHSTVPFFRVNVDEHEELAEEYEIAALPTFVLKKNKETLGQFTGTKLEKVIEAIIKNK